MQENYNFTFTTMGTEIIFGAGSIKKLIQRAKGAYFK